MEIGVDIVEIDRIRRSLRYPRFLERIFTAQEVKYCRAHKNAAQHFAVRFAAKEAVWKAVSGHVAAGRHGGLPLLHRDIQVRNQDDGKPEVIFPKRFAKLAKRVSISLSHGREYAVAMAIYDGVSK
jgi:holo-[acyl-carrier protein] synthase